jgi:hypothetical protein
MVIKSIVGFIRLLNKIHKTDKEFEFFYRGHSDSSFKLLPSIYRKNSFIRNEDKIFKEIILRTPNDFINEKTAIEKLVKMQHYGIPTRLLDISSNPFIALYFACKEHPDKDGEIIIFKIPKNEIKFYDSDTVSIIANLSKRQSNFDISLIDDLKLEHFNITEEIAFLLHEIREEKPHFLPIINKDDFNKVIAVKVKLNNQRIIKQNGAFLIFGINKSKMKSAQFPDNWIYNNSFKYSNFSIDKAQKKRIINGLDILGINESTLFPEIDNQAKYIKQQYEQK